MYAGPNGSGKSTITRRLRREHPLENWIDPDVIARAFSGGGAATDNQLLAAFSAARKFRSEFALQRKDFGFETVFSHGSNVRFLKALKAIGYQVILYFVSTEDARINIERVKNRVQLGGHSVPEKKITHRYERSAYCLSMALTVCDRVFLFDNSLKLTEDGQAGRLVGELSNEMRAVVERSVEQAKLDSYIQAAQEAVSTFEQWVKASQVGAQAISKKAMSFAEHNMLSAFELAQKMVQAKDIQELIRMQTEFVQSQMQALGEQVKDLGETATKTAMESVKDLGEIAEAAVLSPSQARQDQQLTLIPPIPRWVQRDVIHPLSVQSTYRFLPAHLITEAEFDPGDNPGEAGMAALEELGKAHYPAGS